MDPWNGYTQGGAAEQQFFDTIPYTIKRLKSPCKQPCWLVPPNSILVLGLQARSSSRCRKNVHLAHLFPKNFIEFPPLNTGYRVGLDRWVPLFMIRTPPSEPDLFVSRHNTLLANNTVDGTTVSRNKKAGF